MKKFKKLFVCMLVCILCFTDFMGNIAPVQAADSYTVKVKVTYGQSEARTMLKSINSFRTGSDAWAWDASNSKREKYENLGNLVYDYALEEIAMQRAAEIALAFSHTRPDDSRCFDATASDGTRTWGENIAAGQQTANEAFVSWREDNDPYEGQGHRRNMLGNFEAIGIGHVVCDGTHYWVQEFGYSASGAAKTAALDKTKNVKVKVSKGQIKEVEPAETILTLSKGKKRNLSGMDFKLSLGESWPGLKNVKLDVSLDSGDSSIVKVSGTTVTAKKKGTTYLKIKALGQTKKVKVTVK